MKFISNKDTISVYQFMSLCGLEVEYKENILLSHKAMMKKLRLRKGIVTIPNCLPFDSWKNEDIILGRVILVRDDYDKVLGYQRPNLYKANYNAPKTEEEKKKRREELLAQYILELESQKKKMKPGYQKYLKRKGIGR